MELTTEGRNNERRLEVYNTILLAIATLAVAWCSYQSTLWSGIQTFLLAQSNKNGSLAQQAIIQSGQTKTMEEAVVIDFVNAAFNSDQRKVNYILSGIRPELAKVLSDWVQMRPFENPSVPRHPMLMPGYDLLMQKRMEEAKKFSLQGQGFFAQAQQANLSSDTYSLLTVIFSAVMFLGAITTKLLRNKPRIILTLVSLLLCLGAIAIIFFKMPIAARG